MGGAVIESILMPESEIINERLIDCIFEKENVNRIKFQKVLGNDFRNEIEKHCVKRKVSDDYILELEKYIGLLGGKIEKGNNVEKIIIKNNKVIGVKTAQGIY